jgi:hypothetical protein
VVQHHAMLTLRLSGSVNMPVVVATGFMTFPSEWGDTMQDWHE